MTSANKARRMKRATADRLLAEAIGRIREVNTDPMYCYAIVRLVVFGSYANSDRDDLGDLDLAIQVVPRYEKGDPHLEAARDRYHGTDPYMRHYWPVEEVMRKVRNRNAYISIHRIGDPEQDGIIFADRTIEIDLEAVE